MDEHERHASAFLCVRLNELTDEGLVQAVKLCAQAIVDTDDPAIQCVYVARMKTLLEESVGQSIFHGDHIQWFKDEGRELP